ncbi:MAG TPA: VOC family protein [Ktedonobacteraceae bacterium]|nr:VOC family protein [Ktedonobacteraceae bacterium]
MTITLKKLTPNIMVEDVNRTIQFYKETLGFELLTSVPEKGQFDWAMMKRDGVEIMFQARASLGEEIPALQQKEIGGALTFYIDIEGVEELHAILKDKVTIVQEMHTTFYGAQEFAIQDCNGYILTFAEAVG